MSGDEEPEEATEEAGAEAEGAPDPAAIEAALEDVRERVETLEAELDDAETESDLDDVEAELETVRSALDDVEIPPEPEADDDADEDAEPPEDPFETAREREGELADALDDVESGIEDERGPYASEAIDEVEAAASEIESTRWTEEGESELHDVVREALESINAILGTSLSMADDEDILDRLVATLERAASVIDDADLDPDDDADTIEALLETTDDLTSGVDDSTAWTDLEVREQLRREGYYDVLDHVKDFPPEWHALKVHEKRGNVDMVLLALESLDSDFMEEHCLEALQRLAPKAAIEPMLRRAGRRDQAAIRILGKIGIPDDEVVETLLDYVDANDLLLRTTTIRALGEIGAEAALQPIADQLVAESSEVRSNAARALGLIGDTRAIDPLAEVLADDESDTVRASAAWALAQIGTAAALAAVEPYADDRAYLVQSAVERAT